MNKLNADFSITSETFNYDILTVTDDGNETGFNVSCKANYIPNTEQSIFIDSAGVGIQKLQNDKMFQIRTSEDGATILYTKDNYFVQFGISSEGMPFLNINGNTGSIGKVLGSNGKGGLTWIDIK